jgi:peptidyl-prolyl cis-trans isomerase B (cyclophilin B)
MKTATIETAKGAIHLQLFDETAPKTVENFVKLAKEGFYDGCTFHRVIPNFMIQGGDPNSKTLPAGNPRIGTGGPGWKIKCETAGNPQKHTPGTLSMAHAGKDTGGSQFFITHKATPHLDGVHTVFGRVVGPADQKVVDAIQANDKMLKVTIDEPKTA